MSKKIQDEIDDLEDQLKEINEILKPFNPPVPSFFWVSLKINSYHLSLQDKSVTLEGSLVNSFYNLLLHRKNEIEEQLFDYKMKRLEELQKEIGVHKVLDRNVRF